MSTEISFKLRPEKNKVKVYLVNIKNERQVLHVATAPKSKTIFSQSLRFVNGKNIERITGGVVPSKKVKKEIKNFFRSYNWKDMVTVSHGKISIN